MKVQARVPITLALLVAAAAAAACGGKVRPRIVVTPPIGTAAPKAFHEVVVLLFQDEDGFCTLAPASSLLRVRAGDDVFFTLKKIGSFNGCSEDDFTIEDFVPLDGGASVMPLNDKQLGKKKRKGFAVKDGLSGRKFKYAIKTKSAVVDPELDVM